jgi:hypothetical protein
MAGCRDWHVQVVNPCTSPDELRGELHTEPFSDGNYSSLPGISNSQPFVCAPPFATNVVIFVIQAYIRIEAALKSTPHGQPVRI